MGVYQRGTGGGEQRRGQVVGRGDHRVRLALVGSQLPHQMHDPGHVRRFGRADGDHADPRCSISSEASSTGRVSGIQWPARITSNR